MQASLRTIADARSTELEPVSTALHGPAPLAQTKWATGIRKQKLTQRLAADFAGVLRDVAAFADPRPARQHKRSPLGPRHPRVGSPA